jgi:hypothetical protein
MFKALRPSAPLKTVQAERQEKRADREHEYYKLFHWVLGIYLESLLRIKSAAIPSFNYEPEPKPRMNIFVAGEFIVDTQRLVAEALNDNPFWQEVFDVIEGELASNRDPDPAISAAVRAEVISRCGRAFKKANMGGYFVKVKR